MTAKKTAAVDLRPVRPFATGTVGPGGEPSGHYWDRLKAAKTADDLDELEDELSTHKYSVDGQLRQAVAAKRTEMGSATRRRSR